MGDFLRFETMITPVLIQILFWLGAVVSIVIGIMAFAFGASDNHQNVAIGLGFIILGPIVLRIYAEILIIVFRINDHLRHIDHNTQRV
jgi:hypothetical protein